LISMVALFGIGVLPSRNLLMLVGAAYGTRIHEEAAITKVAGQ
jgi:hypothetical protein